MICDSCQGFHAYAEVCPCGCGCVFCPDCLGVPGA